METINNSRELSKMIKIKHSDIMEFYWYMEKIIINKRKLIKCTLVVGEKTNHLKDMSDSLILAILINFSKTAFINKIDF